MKPTTISVADAAHECGLTSRKLTEWAGLGLVPGATHDRPRAKWVIDRAQFMAGIDVLKATVAKAQKSLGAKVQRKLPGTAPDVAAERALVEKELIPAINELTGLPEVVAKPTSTEPPRGVVAEVTDAVRFRTVQEHLDEQARGVEWPLAWTVPAWSLVLAIVVAVGVLLTMKG